MRKVATSVLRDIGRAVWFAQNWLVGIAILAAILIGFRVWPHQSLQAWKPSSVAIYDDRNHLLRLTLASDERYRLWVPLRDMSPQLVDAVLLREDRWYYWHPGINPNGLARGFWVTYVRHRHPQGGSTIAMSSRGSCWPLNTRTPLGKLEQIGRAAELELFYSKGEILEAYLNDAPYGRNVEGAGAASLIYFGKPVAALTLPEALTLAVIPRDPAGRLAAARSASGVITLRLTAERNRLYARWLGVHPEDEALKPLFALPMTIRPLSALPFEAPHAVEQVLEAQRIAGGANEPRIVTTLDLDTQHVLERQISSYVVRNGGGGIRNASAILIDTRDMGVKALVGSANYFDRTLLGQVNGTLARRSPGSTLKPFIYALGFDQGILHPQTVLRDVPTSFGPYTPENFDGRFLGPITATDALNRSRNIPAVWIASQLHAPDLYQFLQSAGIGHLASEQHYGLALVLGGGEVSMQELAGLYTMLANRGVLKPLRLRADAPQSAGTRLVSAEASFMVLDMLRQHVRPDEILRRATATDADLLEDGNILGVSRRLDGRKFRSLCSRRLGGEFRRHGKSRLCRRRCGSAVVFPDRGQHRGRASRTERARAPAPAISRAWRFVSRAASCPIAGARNAA